MAVLQDFDVLDLDRPCDLDNSLIHEAVEVELLDASRPRSTMIRMWRQSLSALSRAASKASLVAAAAAFFFEDGNCVGMVG